jgi:2-polyprenyl-3-methyl-5-hydroxy-6-metoxy-1,4-benzoquinol methylase
MTFDKETVKNSDGFYSIKNLPTKNELSQFYQKQYFQNETTRPKEYQEEYDEIELKYKNLINEQCFYSIFNVRPDWKQKNINFLEVGVGEGFLINYAKKIGLTVEGIDYNNYAIKKFNPKILDHVKFGDPLEILHDLKSKSRKYHVCVIRNVMEHVIDPIELLQTLEGILDKNGLIIITVPNDFSNLQLRAHELNHVNEKFWITSPDHLHYFGTENLKKFTSKMNFNLLDMYSTFPIDFFLFHPNSNYIENKEVGKLAHKARIEIDLILAKNGLPNYHLLSQSFAKCGVGRDITVILEKNHD